MTPPDPASHVDRSRRPGVPVPPQKVRENNRTGGKGPLSVPAPPKKETNWAAMSALAGVAAAVIAFLAYAIPSGSPAQHPSPSSTSPISQESSHDPAPPTEQDTTLPAPVTSPVSSFSAPALAQPSGPPAGCQQGQAAINTYNQLVGSTWYSREDAAEQAGQGIDAAIESGASGTVGADLSALANDFEGLFDTAMGEASTAWDTVSAQTGKDARKLNTDCSTS
jgi:hypothetical protein